MDRESTISQLLQHVAFSLARQSDQVLQEQLGIGFSQYKILLVLGQSPSIQQKVIAHKLGQTEASISRQIKLMHEAGFLSTHIRADNRREHITQLTQKGEVIADKALDILQSYHAPTFTKLSSKQQQQLHDLLTLVDG